MAAQRRPFRFGVQLESADSARDWVHQVRRVEDLGFDSLLVPDHFEGQLAPVSALAVAAQATSRLRLGSMVFANGFRHPAVLAKEMATLDVLSGGRAEVGLGAGWNAEEHRGAGLEFGPPGRRVEQVEESVSILLGIWTARRLSFHGRHYTLHDHPCGPRPLQQPHPPLLLPAAGPRMLACAARRATIADVTAGFADAAATTARVARLAELTAGRSRPPELCALLHTALPGGRAALDTAARALDWSPERAASAPCVLIGDPRTMAELLVERRERWGISYVVCPRQAIDALAPVVALLAGT
jgi:probable F420-dependent oxidoreductase